MTMMDKITQSLKQRRKNGGCSMWREVGIPKMVNLGNWNKLKDWEKEYFLDGITKGYWDKSGNHIGDNSNPYIKKKKRITER